MSAREGESPLPVSDRQRFEAAEGWFMLRNPQEAGAELEKISANFREHPDVLQLRSQVSWASRDWRSCLEATKTLILKAPERPFPWLYQAMALDILSQTRQAYDCLKAVAHRFPRNGQIHHDLACYACKLGRENEGMRWISIACRIDPQFRIAALDHPYLEPLWEKIAEI